MPKLASPRHAAKATPPQRLLQVVGIFETAVNMDWMRSFWVTALFTSFVIVYQAAGTEGPKQNGMTLAG